MTWAVGGFQRTWVDGWEDGFNMEAAALAELVYKVGWAGCAAPRRTPS